MQKLVTLISILLFVVFLQTNSFAQKRTDSIVVKTDSLKKHSPRKVIPRVATIRSAILPGLGQIYNRKYWKLPLVYGAIGATTGIFIYNVNNYRRLRDAYRNKTDGISSNDVLIYYKYRNLSAGALRSYRNVFRQNVDYSALFFLVFWGLNVVDATVDAHLHSFDVNDNISFQFKPGYSNMANTSGMSLVINIGKH